MTAPLQRSLPLLLALTASIAPAVAQESTNFPHLGRIHRLDPALDAVLAQDAELEVVASGFVWSEGPVWMPDAGTPQGGCLLFSDIPRNEVLRWVEGQGISVFLKPSGYTGVGDYGNEPGSNGLAIDPRGRLVSCEHGDRRISVLVKNGGKRTLVDNYQGKRLNSPNDLVFKSNGDLYFTDPPYGLPRKMDDPRAELGFCGVYRLATDGQLDVLTDKLARPNGIAFSPDEQTLYVAQSDPQAAHWTAFQVQPDGRLSEGHVLYDATHLVGENHLGLPDGLKVDQSGNLWATGPGGVHILSPQGKPLGRIETGERTSNCGWGNDGSVLYLTADSYVCRIQTKTQGAGW